MQPEIRTLAAQRVVYAEAHGLVDGSFSKAAGEAFFAVHDYLNRNGLWPRVGLAYSAMPDGDEVPPDAQRYQAGHYLLDDDPLPPADGIEVATLDVGKVAVYAHVGPYDQLPAAWHHVFHEELPVSGLQVRPAPCLELYVNNPMEVPEAQLFTEIVIPVA